MPVPSQGHYGFHSFPVVDWFVCLYNYEFWLSLCKIVRSSVILLLPLSYMCCPTGTFGAIQHKFSITWFQNTIIWSKNVEPKFQHIVNKGINLYYNVTIDTILISNKYLISQTNIRQRQVKSHDNLLFHFKRMLCSMCDHEEWFI